MKRFKARKTYLVFMLILSVFLIAACDGNSNNHGSSAGAGLPDTTAPTATLTVPVDGATGVPIGNMLTVAFTEAMDPVTINKTTFTLKQGAAPVSGTPTYDVASRTATFAPDSDLDARTPYTAMISTGAEDSAGNPLASDFVWSFTTGAAPDTTAPTVTGTVPDDGALLVPVGNKLAATFSENMDPATIDGSAFTVKNDSLGGIAVAGDVTYAVAGKTATFTPTTDLAANSDFTATITTMAEDLAFIPNPLASDKVWTFRTGAAPDITAPTVSATNPADFDVDVCSNKTINATFDEAMDPTTITTAAFNLRTSGPPLGPVLAGTVAYDALTKIATFNPTADLAANTDYTATVKGGAGGVKDLAGNALAADEVYTFTTGTTTCTPPIDLGALTPFAGAMGGIAGITNSGILTVVNGDLGTTAASTLITGFHDSVGDIYTETPLNIGAVNGRIYTDAPPPAGAGVGGNAVTFDVATQAAADAVAAYNAMVALPPGPDSPTPGNLGSQTLTPGVYTAAGGSFMIQGGDLTLDAQGDPNAVWVFQMATTLTVGGPGAAFPQSVILANGAQPKNVYWQVGSAATINAAGGGTMVGTIITQTGATISTAGNLNIVTLEGRALSLGAAVTMVNTVINVPAP